ncbi:MAG: YggT family protein [Chromatiaceae bacterium]|nr:YggT family protein [Chromatiaceae bacterium]MBP8024753.1 YggT family protein [Chromatiaceae bacterium]MBP9604234.1 YggT family protein [Chromatiaceae bacterium]
MTGNYLTNPLIFLIQTLGGFYAFVAMLRFLLQLTKADFYNPVSQFVVKVTSPVLMPLRRFIPGFRGMDISSLVLAWLVKTAVLFLVGLLAGLGLASIGAVIWSIPALVELTIDVFIYAVIVRVVLSWVNPNPSNPMVRLIEKLTDPVMEPVQRRLPAIGGLDLSPIAVTIGLVLLQMLLIPPLKLLTGSPF